ncbi:MAG: hypothetical protein BIFFINMI_02092 [Phycisphaerae bacterium]|nr:hypothetical protein [Phycisphaerae bacterium]
MNKFVVIAVVLLVGLVAVQTLLLAGERGDAQVNKVAPGGSPQGGEGVYAYAYVPAVPTPPGVIGQYSQLPCAVEIGGTRSVNVENLVHELGERGWQQQQ